MMRGRVQLHHTATALSCFSVQQFGWFNVSEIHFRENVPEIVTHTGSLAGKMSGYQSGISTDTSAAAAAHALASGGLAIQMIRSGLICDKSRRPRRNPASVSAVKPGRCFLSCAMDQPELTTTTGQVTPLIPSSKQSQLALVSSRYLDLCKVTRCPSTHSQITTLLPADIFRRIQKFKIYILNCHI